jgi:hypothetical protein
MGGYQPPEGLSWNEDGGMVDDFDFDAFLANFGIGTEITDLLGVGGEVSESGVAGAGVGAGTSAGAEESGWANSVW